MATVLRAQQTEGGGKDACRWRRSRRRDGPQRRSHGLRSSCRCIASADPPAAGSPQPQQKSGDAALGRRTALVAVASGGVSSATALTAQKLLSRSPWGGLSLDEQNTVDVFNSSTPSVVFITNLQVRRDAFTLDEFESPQGAGSGFVWDSSGHVVTNSHVISGANDVRVTLGDKRDTSLPAKIVGQDYDKDVAVLKLEDTNGKALSPVKLGVSTNLQVGQKLLAIGNPFGLDHTCTAGIISGLGREISSGNTGRPIEGVIQTDAAINPGNSGGPVLNTHGEFIGMSTAIYSASGSSSGVGFALPVDMLKGIVQQLINYGRVTRPVLGVSFAPDASSQQLGLPGVLVLSVRPGSPAAEVGIRPTTRDDKGRLMLGDVITAINNEKIESSTDLFKALDNRSVGESVAVEVQRGNRKENVNVALKDISSLPTEPNLSAQDVRPLEPGAEEGSPFGN